MRAVSIAWQTVTQWVLCRATAHASASIALTRFSKPTLWVRKLPALWCQVQSHGAWDIVAYHSPLLVASARQLVLSQCSLCETCRTRGNPVCSLQEHVVEL